MQALILLQRYETFRYEQTFKQLFFMDAKQITNIITRVPQLVEKAMRDEIPCKTAVIAKITLCIILMKVVLLTADNTRGKNT